jgi:hypothetical protein
MEVFSVIEGMRTYNVYIHLNPNISQGGRG